MLFREEADMDDRVVAVPLVASRDEVYLNNFFLPRPPHTHIRSAWGPLAQPRPDTAIGYVTRRAAASSVPKCQAPFSADEEQTLQALPLTQHLLFPFLTAQWKAQIANENMLSARNQAAREGAAIVNHLHQYYSIAYNREPSIVQTCHFSLTCDIDYAEIWVHWRDKMAHYMELVDGFSLRKLDDVSEVRSLPRNILNHALGQRLRDIMDAIPSFKAKKDVSIYYI